MGVSARLWLGLELLLDLPNQLILHAASMNA